MRKRTPVDNHPGLKAFRAAREMAKRKATHRQAILAENPNISPVMLKRLVQTRLEKEIKQA